MRDLRRVVVACVVTALVPWGFRAQEAFVPNKPKSLKFAAIATVAGAVLALSAARLLSVGRFGNLAQPLRQTHVQLIGQRS